MGAYGGHQRGLDFVGSRLSHIGKMITTFRHHNVEVLARIVGNDIAIIVTLEHI
jgi:hypothetical protein